MGAGKKLIVIGNGFDLKAKANTSYMHFFESKYYEETKMAVVEWLCTFKEYNKGNLTLREKLSNITRFNCWDLFFYLESTKEDDHEESKCEEIQWCDIERAIYDSLLQETGPYILWEKVFFAISKYNIHGRTTKNRIFEEGIMIEFLKCNHRDVFCYDKSIFYEWLLDELKRFETNFGHYISEISNTDEYINETHSLIRKMCDDEQFILVDSFNYSDFSNAKINIRHINGDCNNPVFGINLSHDDEKRHSEIKRFTKTSRRVYQDVFNLNKDTAWESDGVIHALVYGHSLNDMDYDYFNYLFTMLRFNTLEIEKMGTIEFLYSIYDESKRDEIRNNYADAVYKLVNYYEDYVSKASDQRILLNLLRFSGKLKIREI